MDKNKEKADFDCVVVANGLFPEKEEVLAWLKVVPKIIACDGAARKLLVGGYHVDAIVGDLDSLPEELKHQYVTSVHHSAEQMSNDLTKAMRFACKRGFRKVLILGATGLREDHTLGNISLLTQYIDWFDKVEMRSDFGVFIPLKETTILPSAPGQQVSIFSITPQTEITATGLRWEVKDRPFDCWWQGTLNESLEDEFTIAFSGDAKIVIYQAYIDNKKRKEECPVL